MFSFSHTPIAFFEPHHRPAASRLQAATSRRSTRREEARTSERRGPGRQSEYTLWTALLPQREVHLHRPVESRYPSKSRSTQLCRGVDWAARRTGSSARKAMKHSRSDRYERRRDTRGERHAYHTGVAARRSSPPMLPSRVRGPPLRLARLPAACSTSSREGERASQVHGRGHCSGAGWEREGGEGVVDRRMAGEDLRVWTILSRSFDGTAPEHRGLLGIVLHSLPLATPPLTALPPG
jgi:hypothetical protein